MMKRPPRRGGVFFGVALSWPSPLFTPLPQGERGSGIGAPSGYAADFSRSRYFSRNLRTFGATTNEQ